jgi:hypothetical protein
MMEIIDAIRGFIAALKWTLLVVAFPIAQSVNFLRALGG